MAALDGPSRRDFSQGPVLATNGPYDLALQGPGFFVLSDGSLTRNGALAYCAQSHFLASSSGTSLMGYRKTGESFSSAPEAVCVPEDASNVEIDPNGLFIWTRINSDKPEVGYRLAVARVEHPEELAGDGVYFRSLGTIHYGIAGKDGLATIARGHLEMPALDPYEERLVAASLLDYAGLPAPSR